MKRLTCELPDDIYAKLVEEASFLRRKTPEDQVAFSLAAHYQMPVKFDPRARPSRAVATQPTAVPEVSRG